MSVLTRATQRKIPEDTILLKRICWKYLDWIHMPQNWQQWRAFANAARKVRGSINGGFLGHSFEVSKATVFWCSERSGGFVYKAQNLRQM
jgi:hypothetical protein